eukprot:TRINITY_DN244_c0_g1_i3.p1 TRINITY_DN244_c0_g1~~TRINITY_DN244_c0_g1_i3.p1  ORF type:complete len:104 (-),score=23.45 TRINITY_DN244_c0_g1_i3:203-514(-)
MSLPAYSARVRDLYRQFIHIGKSTFLGVDVIRKRVKPQFLKARDLKDPKEIEKEIAKSEYILKELEAMSMLHKYRKLKKDYNSLPEEVIEGFINLDNPKNFRE